MTGATEKSGRHQRLQGLAAASSCRSEITGVGREYLYPCWRKRLNSWIQDRLQKQNARVGRYLLHWLSTILFKSFVIWPPPDPYFEGSWWGNDTLWRTILDLNRIARYANQTGRMHESPQRKILVLMDAVIAGEEEGPLEPRAKPCGYLIAGLDPAMWMAWRPA